MIFNEKIHPCILQKLIQGIENSIAVHMIEVILLAPIDFPNCCFKPQNDNSSDDNESSKLVFVYNVVISFNMAALFKIKDKFNKMAGSMTLIKLVLVNN